jgi:hypothetical protein
MAGEERSVILVIDCYSRRDLLTKKPTTNQGPSKPPNIFKTEAEYEHFLRIYERW